MIFLLLCLSRPDLLNQFVTDFVHIAYDPVVTVIENLGFRVFIDCDKEIRIDAGRMVHRAGNAAEARTGASEERLHLQRKTAFADDR